MLLGLQDLDGEADEGQLHIKKAAAGGSEEIEGTLEAADVGASRTVDSNKGPEQAVSSTTDCRLTGLSSSCSS